MIKLIDILFERGLYSKEEKIVKINLEETFDVCENKIEEFLYELAQLQQDNNLNEAKYQGRTVTLNKPMQGDIKKFKVYVKNDKGKIIKVNFGFGGKSAKGKRMHIKVNNPKRRSAYRKRHNCKNPGPKWKANYWSCKAW